MTYIVGGTAWKRRRNQSRRQLAIEQALTNLLRAVEYSLEHNPEQVGSGVLAMRAGESRQALGGRDG